MLSFDEWRQKVSEQQAPTTTESSPLTLEHQARQNNNQPHDSTIQPKLHQAKAPLKTETTELNDDKSDQLPLKFQIKQARNFASHECGAKIVSYNEDATFVNRALNEYSDEYMLHPCKSSKNWFVIQLCETIQPQYLELANYELYSSIPKHFVVHASEQYPARNDWSFLGKFFGRGFDVAIT